MRIPELLAPAGSMDALRAAVHAGADAVYLGASGFGARASANFTPEELEEGVNYAHFHHCRVYVTVNTLVKPGELSQVRQVLCMIAQARADGVIVQDLGVARLVLEEFPSLALHASTQMAICTAQGAAYARKAGFERVVLARECTLAAIREVTATGIETEVFVHGALCSSVSGRCLMSSMAGGRSGNRGRCAQPCRLPFCMGAERGALLSLKDLCLLEKLPELAAAGVCSLKIEGRLKSPEYVAVVTGEYRKALDRLRAGEKASSSPEGMENLRQVFNRGGFTQGHVFGAEDAALTTGVHVSHEGIPLGKVIAVQGHMARLALEHELHNNDSLQIHAGAEVDLRYSGPDCKKGEIAQVYLREPFGVCAGDGVSRLSSARQLEGARALAPRPVPVTGKAFFRENIPASMELNDGVNRVCIEGFVPQKAEKRPTTREEALRQLSRFGDSPFALAPGGLEVDMQEPLFLPVAALNQLRREACAALAKERVGAFEKVSRKPASCDRGVPRPRFAADALSYGVISPLLSLGERVSEKACFVYAPRCMVPGEVDRELSTVEKPLWLRIPPQTSDACLRELVPVLKKHKNQLTGLWLESFSHMALLPEFPAIAGEGVPVTNGKALELLEPAGLSAFCLWPEWTRRERFSSGELPAFVHVYGRLPVMLLNHCPKRAEQGLSRNRAACKLCREPDWACGQKNAHLTDQKGYTFPLMRTVFPEGCEISLLSALPTVLFDSLRDMEGLIPLLSFTVEGMAEQLRLLRGLEALLRGENPNFPELKSTTGHWAHGVE